VVKAITRTASAVKNKTLAQMQSSNFLFIYLFNAQDFTAFKLPIRAEVLS
jgi:hypothetical protein